MENRPYNTPTAEIAVNGRRLKELAAARISRQPAISLKATGEAELLLVDMELP